MASRGLGKNLNALLSNTKAVKKVSPKKPESGYQKLRLEQLQPGKYQPRQDMDEDNLSQLADSIKQQGVIQPLAVREIQEGQYEIIAGERRWRASKLAGLNQVPVIVHQVDDETAMALALIENLQREDLNPMDEARALQRLHDEFELTHLQIANLVSKSRTAVTNLLRLMNLNEEVKRLLEHGDIEMGHARALLSLESAKQAMAANLIITRGLSVREAEQLVSKIKQGVNESKPSKPQLASAMTRRINTLARQLNHKIDIKHNDKGKGKLVIHFKDLEKLESLLDSLEVNN